MLDNRNGGRFTGPMAALSLAMLLASLGVSVATVAQPTLTREFAATVPHVQWVVLAYLLSVTVTIVLAGRLGDLIGLRRVLLSGFGVFALASLLCAAAPTLNALIAGRALQGVGGAVLMALPISLIRATVAKERTGAAMGLMGAMSGIGTALGPSVGGVLIDWSGWRTPFLVLAGVATLGALLALRRLPAGSGRKAGLRGALDLLGTLVLAVALTAYSLAVTGGQHGSGVPWMLVAAAATVLFLIIESRQDQPLVRLSALANRVISLSLFTNLVVTTAMMATLVVGPYFLAFSLGLREASIGLVMAVGPVAAALAGVPAGRVTDKLGTARVLLLGLAQIVLGLVCFAVLPGHLGVAGYIVSLILLTPGFQLFLAANNTAVMMAAPDGQQGLMSGLLGLSRNLGFMTGASVMGAIFVRGVGTRDIAGAGPEAVGVSFASTFLIAAVMAVVALGVSVLVRPEKARAPEASRS